MDLISRLLFFVIIVLSSVACRNNIDRELDHSLKELDKVLANKALYEKQKNKAVGAVLEQLKHAENDMQRLECYDNLAGKYSHYRLDSSAYYAHMMQQLAQSTNNIKMINAAKIRVVVVMIGNAELAAAQQILNSIDISDSENVDLARYYSNKATIFRESKRFCILPGTMKFYDDSLRYCINQYIALATEPGADIYKRTYRAELLRLNHRNKESIKLLTENLRSEGMNIHHQAAITYMISRNYADMGDITNSELYAAQAAVYHLSTPERAYMSLYRLAELLYESGDIKRANYYIQRTLDDATQSNYRLRIGQYCESLKTITQTFDKHIKSKSQLMVFVIISTSVFALVILILLLVINRRKRVIERMKDGYKMVNEQLLEANMKLNTTNKILLETNRELYDANMIRAEYVSQYMQLCVAYIQRLDTYRMDLIRAVKTKSKEEVLAILRSQNTIYDEHKHFLETFDKTFLGLFHDFVQQVNALLKEQYRLVVNNKGQLTTELRYLAVIRLGLSDSAQIAAFLNCTVSTIYTYRARLRNARLNNNLDLEDMVRMINISKHM